MSKQAASLFDVPVDLPETPGPARLARVLVPYPVDRAYSYAIPDGMAVQAGDYVAVPLGPRQVPGVVWAAAADDEETPSAKIKTIAAKYDLPPMTEVQRRFVDWTAHYTMSPLGFVLKMALSVPGALAPGKPVAGYRLATALAATNGKFLSLSPPRRRVVDALSDGIPRRAAEIAELAECSTAIVKGLERAGVLEAAELSAAAPCAHPKLDSRVTLSATQSGAAEHLRDLVGRNEFQPVLLDGVTGAGKTEVYFEAVAAALANGRQALILLPEIALSNAFLDRFRVRFGCQPALWHSQLTPHQRKSAWRGIAEGRTRVVVGARSALYLPYADLGVIIVDEEHDPAYKQEDGVIYHARDMAVVRARLGAIPIVLVSATPSLETMTNVWAGKYQHLHLPDRHAGARLPDIHVIDMKADKPERQHFIAPSLRRAVEKNLAGGGQSLLFLNRRGYAPLTLCRACGHRMECPRCTAWLVEHKKTSRLQCHHCGFNIPQPKHCPACQAEDSFVPCGPGVERILEEVRAYWPEARTVVMASDVIGSHAELRDLLKGIRDHAYDIIIGTQIIAKGHHFPQLTLVGVIDADLGLNGGDLRAAERTFQLLHQVAGRAGREERPGTVYLQTYLPGNKVMQALSDHERDRFLEAEAQEREAARMPPFTRLAGIIVSGKDEDQVEAAAIQLGRAAPHNTGEAGALVQTLGPAEAPFYRLRGRYRRRLLLRADRAVNLQKTIEHWLASVKVPSSVRVVVDIDPQSFL